MRLVSPVDAVFFDAAGTLLQLRESVGQTYSRTARRHGFNLPADALDAVFREQWRAMPESNPGAALPDDGRGWWRRLVFGSLDRLGVPSAPARRDALFGELYDLYADPTAWELFPETRATLESLESIAGGAGTALRLAVISNWDGRLRGILKGLGIGGFFERIVISSEIGFSKPHPGIFRAACAALGLEPRRCLHVGDDPERDWAGAEAAGLQVYQLDRATGATLAGIETAIPGLGTVQHAPPD